MTVVPIVKKTQTGRKRRSASKFKDFTLEKHSPLAEEFLKRWSIGDTVLVDDFEKWAVDIGRLPKIDAEVLSSDPKENSFRTDQRNKLREDINLGAMCSDFEESRKFQIAAYEHGKSYRVVALYEAVTHKSKNIFERNGETLRNSVINLEKQFQAVDLNQLTEEQRIFLLSNWNLLGMAYRNYESLVLNFNAESTALLERVSTSMAAIERVFPQLALPAPFDEEETDTEDDNSSEVA